MSSQVRGSGVLVVVSSGHFDAYGFSNLRVGLQCRACGGVLLFGVLRGVLFSS